MDREVVIRVGGRRWLAACAAGLLGVGLCGAPALADTPSTSSTHQTSFYTPPNPLPPGHNGDLIRSEPMTTLPPTAATATRLMYRSTNSQGKAVAVTGTYFAPKVPWQGAGARPLIDLAVGTIGQGDQCAPSKLFHEGINLKEPGGPIFEYEWMTVDSLLSKGYAVVVSDYDGLGTPGVHTYVNRADEADAVLDAARAARQVPGSGITRDDPVGLWGYSQGGGAVAAAAETAEDYAPDVPVAATYAGAPPADLRATLRTIDGSSLTGAIGYALNSMAASYPQLRPLIQNETNAKGKAMLRAVAGQCVGNTIARYAFHNTSEYTRTGESLDKVLDRYPIAQQVIDEQKIGNRKPDAPVMLASNVNDDYVPYQQVKQLAQDWRAKGASVRMITEPLPPLLPGAGIGHLAPSLITSPLAMDWMSRQLANAEDAQG